MYISSLHSVLLLLISKFTEKKILQGAVLHWFGEYVIGLLGKLLCFIWKLCKILYGFMPPLDKVLFFLFIIIIIIFFYFTILYWFCHTSTCICHRCTHIPHPEPPSHLPPHTILLGHPSAPAPSFLDPASNLDWQFIFYMILYMFSEKAMAPHSSTLAWKIPWTEEPGRLQSMGSLRVRHDWATSLSPFTFMHWRRKWQPTLVFLPGESQGWLSLAGCHLWGGTESDTTEVT